MEKFNKSKKVQCPQCSFYFEVKQENNPEIPIPFPQESFFLNAFDQFYHLEAMRKINFLIKCVEFLYDKRQQ